MAVRRPKRPRLAGSSSNPSDTLPPVTPTGSRSTGILCEPWMIPTRQAPRALQFPAPAPLLVLPGRQRLTQNIRSSPRRSLVQPGESNPHSPGMDPFVDDGPRFSDSLYMPNGPIDIPCPRLSGLQKKQNQWRRWSQDVIPSLITPYLAYVRRSGSLQSTPDLGSANGNDLHHSGSCHSRSLPVTCVLFDRTFYFGS